MQTKIEESSLSSFSQSPHFKAFLESGIDRFEFISSFLKERGVSSSAISFSTGKHMMVNFSKKAYNKRYRNRVFVAHYDREKMSPGANDNSAACYILMRFAVYLSTLRYPHNITIIFTDSEEAGKDGIQKQGSYKLALGLHNLGFENADIYIFDMCGRGDALIFSLSGIYGREAGKTSSLQALHKRAVFSAHSLAIPYFSMLTAYSDNAGFVAAGLNAQLVTVLPMKEACVLAKYLGGERDELYAKVLDVVLKNERIPSSSKISQIVPTTWQFMHSPQDSIETLTDATFHLVFSYMKKISATMEKW